MSEMSDSVSPDSSALTVVGTKLRVPSPRSEQVLRHRLLGMLEAGLDCRLTSSALRPATARRSSCPNG